MTRPAQSPADAPRGLPRDTGPVLLYAGALRHLAGRAARFLAVRLLRTADRMDPRPSPRETAGAIPVVLAASRAASKARHPSSFPVHDAPGVVLHLNWRDRAVAPVPSAPRGGIHYPPPPAGHGASEGDPDL